MQELTLQEMEQTRGGIFGSFNHNTVATTIANTATSINVAAIIGSANKSGGVTVAQEADSSAGNIVL